MPPDTDERCPAGPPSGLSVVQSTARQATQSFAQRVQWRRRVARELDQLLDLWKYPDVGVVYARAPSREGEQLK